MSRYKYFTDQELQCRCGCKGDNPNPEFDTLMKIVVLIREELNEPLPITSGYRCKDHPIEAAKTTTGQHQIAAVDIGVSGSKALRLTRLIAQYPQLKGFGVKQKGEWGKRFIHIDVRENPAMWSY